MAGFGLYPGQRGFVRRLTAGSVLCLTGPDLSRSAARSPLAPRGVGMVAGALELRVAALSLALRPGRPLAGPEPHGWLWLRSGLQQSSGDKLDPRVRLPAGALAKAGGLSGQRVGDTHSRGGELRVGNLPGWLALWLLADLSGGEPGALRARSPGAVACQVVGVLAAGQQDTSGRVSL